MTSTGTGRLLELTELLSFNVKAVNTYIRENDLPDPSFDASYPPVLDLPQDVDVARKAALEALDELRDHLLGPLGAIYENVTSHSNLVSLHGLTHFNLASTFPLTSTTTIPSIAQKSNIHPSDAETLIRHGLTHRLFRLLPDGRIAHSAATRAIATVPYFQSWITSGLSTMWRHDSFIVPAMAKWPGSQEPVQTAVNLGTGSDEPFFKAMSRDKDAVRNFSDAMKFFLGREDMRPVFAVEGYDWDAHEEGVVVDVGGSHGVIAVELAKRYPGMKRIVVQDRPEVIATVPRTSLEKESGIQERVEFQAHDFFTEQPVQGADVYFFRYIFHSWSDKYCVAILRALVPALRKGCRVLVMDHVVPEPGELSPYRERQYRVFDVTMKQMFNSKERSASDWRSVLGMADERFKVVEIRRPAGSQLGIVVVEWSG